MKNLIISLILSAIFLTPAFAYDAFNAAEKEFKKGNYLKTNKIIEAELQKHPENLKYRYLYAKSFIGLKNLDLAQKEYEKIIEQSPNSDFARRSFIAISKIYEYQSGELTDDSQEQTSKPSGHSGPSLGDNYINNALCNGKIVRWNLSKMPLKIYINNAVNVRGYQEYYYWAAKAAIDDWVKESEPGTLKYILVNNAQGADISVDFVSNIGKQTDKTYLLGLAVPYTKDNLLETSSMQLRTTDINNKTFSQQEIFATLLHEFGHVLGIWGHSASQADIMYDCESANSSNSAKNLSIRDINTLRILYMLDPEVSNFSPGEKPKINSKKNQFVLGNASKRINNKYQENIDYINKYPQNAVGWVNLGSTYSQTNQNNEAIACYKKALELDASCVEARTNLAVLYEKVGDNENALSNFSALVKNDPKNIGYSYNLALFLAKNDNTEEAYQVLKNLIKVNPEAVNDKSIKKMLNDLEMQ